MAAADFATARGLAYGDPQLFGRLIRTLVEATTDYLLAQAEAGAEALMCSTAGPGCCSPSQFRRWVIEPTAQLVELIKAKHPHVPIIGFPRGAGDCTRNTPRVQACSASASIPRCAWAGRRPRCRPGCRQGNLDPLVLVAGGEALRN